MRVRDYLQKFPEAASVTFIEMVAVKDEGAPGYRDEYRTTPVRTGWEWLRSENFCDEYLVINADHPPLSVTEGWHNWYNHGHLHCAMITTEAELLKQYGEKQGRDMIAYYERTVH